MTIRFQLWRRVFATHSVVLLDYLAYTTGMILSISRFRSSSNIHQLYEERLQLI